MPLDKEIRKKIEKESKYTVENRESKDLVSLGGFAITKSGKITRSDYFAFLGNNLDNYSDIVMTKEQAKKIHNHLMKLSTGSSAMVPLYCSGALCPFATRCPLVQARNDREKLTEEENKHIHPEHGIAPVGRQCIIEVDMLNTNIMRFMEEYQVDPENFTEVAYINELSEIEVYLYRLNVLLSKPDNATLVIDQTVGVSNDGTPILQKQISPYMEQKERLLTRKSKVIKLMVGDRQERYKKEAALKIKDTDDASSFMAKMRKQVEELNRRIKKVNDEQSDDKPGEFYGEGVLTPDDIIANSDE